MGEQIPWRLELFGHWMLSWAAVVAIVSLWLIAARPKRASVRYAAWLLATFAGALLVPISAGLHPRISWSDLWPRSSGNIAAPRTAAPPETFHSWFEGMTQPGQAQRAPTSGAFGPRESLGATPGSSLTPSTASSSPAPALLRPDRTYALAVAVWAIGVAAFLARLGRAALQARALVRRAAPPNDRSLSELLSDMRRSFAIRRPIRLLVHPDIATPMCLGFFRPAILWPTPDNCPMTPRQRRAALVHEVGHLRFCDDWIALFAELWRAASWFFLPVHWTVARLRLECECRCDELAASEFDAPSNYARWLLDLTQVRAAFPVGASLTGTASLAARVRSIVRGDGHAVVPLRKKQIISLMILGLLLVGMAASVRLVGLARAEDPADAPLPEITPQELARHLRAAVAGYDRGLLEITFESTVNTNWRMTAKDATPAEREPILVQFPGRVRYLGDGRRWRMEYDSKLTRLLSKKLSPYRWTSGYDGEHDYEWNVSQNVVTLGGSETSAEAWKPSRLFWPMGDQLPDLLTGPPPPNIRLAITQRTVEGTRCYVIDWTIDSDLRSEVIVSPRQGYLTVSRKTFYKGALLRSWSVSNVRKLPSDRWAPARITDEHRMLLPDGGTHLERRQESRIVTFDLDRSFGDDPFAFEPPYGADVTDWRLGYSYQNDPWWPEVGALLREQFDWPKTELSPLARLRTVATRVDNQALPIEASAWLLSEPLQIDRLKGKVVLLEFWDSTCRYCREQVAPLRALHERFHPFGLEIIAVHAPTDDLESLRQFARQYRIPYPIAIDRAHERTGATSEAYGVQDHPCAFLIDAAGELHRVGAPPAGEAPADTLIVDLLRRARTQPDEIPALVLEQPRMNDEMDAAVTRAIPEWVKQAPADAEIRGRVRNEHGEPIPGARVTARLQVTLLSFARPGGYYLIPQRHRVEATADREGRFVLAGLTKGMYAVRAEAPERAWRELAVAIGPKLEPADVAITLDQPDSITGIVRDEAGAPIAGATVNPAKWHHDLPNGNNVATTPSGAQPTRTNAAGLYVLSSLQHGGYTLEITAPGHTRAELEAVPAGTPDANATLTKDRPEGAPKP